MRLSTKSVIAVQSAKRLILYKDDPPEGGRIYFVVAQVGENRDQEEALTCDDGTRWQGSDREKVMEPVLALRSGMETTDFCGGSVARGPYTDEIDRKLTALLVAMSGKFVAMLSADDIMMLSHGYTIAGKLGIEIGFTHTNVPAGDIAQQLRAIERGDRSVPLCRENAVINVALI